MNNEPIEIVEMENTTEGHAKFWTGELYKDKVVTLWGRIGYEPQSKEFPGKGKEFLEKKMAEKEKKGYLVI